MRNAAVLVLCALIGVAVGFAQQPANTNQVTVPQTQNGSNAAGGQDQNPSNSGFEPRPTGSAGGDVPANTEMRATLDTPLSSKTSKPGDRFTATIAQPVQGQNGVVVPIGARVEGEVSELEQGKDIPALHGRGKLNLRLRDIVLPNGETVPLAAALVSVNHTNSQIEPGAEGRNAARDEITLVFGGPLKGLAIGAMAGGGYVLATNGKDVNLPAQTGMVIRLEQELIVQ